MRITPGKLIGALAVLFVVAQAIVPAKTNPPTDQTKTLKAVRPDLAEAVSVLERSCRDCHSNETTWPWYSSVAPVSWLVARDVNEGRKELNISEFGTYEPKKQQHKLEEACTQVKEGEMPMWIYVIQHPDAKLQPGDVDRICAASLAKPAAAQ